MVSGAFDITTASEGSASDEFRSLVRSLPETLVRYDLDGRIAFVNDQFTSRTGRTLAEVRGSRPFEWGAATDLLSDVGEYRRLLAEVLATGEAREMLRTRAQTTSGGTGSTEVFRVHFTPHRDDDGRLIGAYAVARDVSDLIRARHAVAAREREFHALAENLPDIVLRYDRGGRAIYVNHQFEVQLGTDRRRIIGKRPSEMVPSGMLGIDDYERRLMHVLETGRPDQSELTYVDERGQAHVHSVLLRAERDGYGEILGALAIGRDITDIVAARNEIATREHDLRTLTENVPDIIIRYDVDGRARYINHHLASVRGLGDDSLLGRRPTEIPVEGVVGIDRYEQCLDCVIATGRPAEIEITVPAAAGAHRVHNVRFTAERDEHGRIVGALAVGRDVTELAQAHQRAAENERSFRSLADNATDFIGRWDTEARTIYANPALAALIGGTPETLVSAGGTRRRDGAFSDLLEAIGRVIHRKQPGHVRQRFDDGAAGERIHDVQLVPEFDDTGHLVSVLGIGHDVTQVVRQHEALERAARTDALTGASSRQVLYEELPRLLAECGARSACAAVLMLDLDGFKNVNDQFGHHAGDQILREVARRLSACSSDADLLVRLGGDEFALVVGGVESPAAASALAHQARLQLADIETGDDFRLRTMDASVGIAMYPEDGVDADVLVAHADLALCEAKRRGRGNVEHYRPDLRTVMERRSAIDQALRTCVPDAEMALHFQPISTLGPDPHVWGAEALLRWDHPALGVVTPDEFIPIAEQGGHIVPIGRWVLRRATEMAVELNRGRSHPLRIAVNVSTRQFTLDDIAEAVRSALVASGCEPRWIVLEITESLLLEDLPCVHGTLEQLRELGVAIAIDDFGTGYSALHYLTRLPIDHMKIDKSFVRDADVDRHQQEIVRALVAMAGALDISVVAEGIETSGQAELMRRLGCRLGQGYLMACPMPAGELATWLATSVTSLHQSLPA